MTELMTISLFASALVCLYIWALTLDKIARQDEEIDALTDHVKAVMEQQKQHAEMMVKLHLRISTVEADLEEALTEYEEQEGATLQ